tara:strand:+ start:3549 stop:5012 length:1464 start_codon:yes stop_codon:yes gene_type:complete
MASALEFQQKPINTTSKAPVITNWTPMVGYMLFQDDATTASYFYYKLILEVRLDDASGTIIAKIKQRRNGYSVDINDNKARAFFDLRDIANSVLTPTVFDQNDNSQPFRTIHKVGVNTVAKPFSFNGDRNTDGTQIQKIFVKGYQQYSTSVTSSPAEVTTDTVTDTLYYLEASLPLMTARSSSADYVQSDAFNVYNGAGATDLFLSDLQSDSGEYNLSGYINYIQDTDYHTVAFLNDFTNFASDIDHIEIAYYNSSGSLINSKYYIDNISANGGLPPNDGSIADASRLLYFGCGAGNLEAQSDETSARPSNNSGWAYYTIRGTGNDSGTIAYKTATYYFIKEDGSCKGFKVRRLAWRNSVGGYDYFNFKKKSTQTTEIKRDNYSTMIGTFNKSKYRYNNTQRGQTTRQTTATLKETLNTDWITEAQGVLIEKLLMSTDAQIVQNADTDFTEGVIITDSSFVKKTSANDNLIQYTINIEYANPINTNS